MTWVQDIEQFVPLIKPLFDGLRSAREFFWNPDRRKTGHSIDIPKKTLILLPDVNPFALWWGVGKARNKEAMQINGLLQATNTSEYRIRPAGIRLLDPKGTEVIIQMVTVRNEESGRDSHEQLIPPRSIGMINFQFLVAPVKGKAGHPLRATIAVLDQFGNEHVARGLEFKYMGPETPR